MIRYKTLIYVENLLTTLVPGYSALNEHTFNDFLNEHAKNGWRVTSIAPVTHRSFFLIRHEAFAVVFEKDEDANGV